ncbi:recombinase family protein [Leucobacter sp. USCH14]|uniref:recombinase family protein n=1 Tax=Leucobacter sp. USCH14 TaxID=3024838 RepID=UPI00309C4E29
MNTQLRPVPAVRPRAVLYLRQSVARDDSISLELQEIAGRDHCARSGYDVVRVEVDEGISGRTWAKRPAVQRVMGMIESREADVIVLWKWSRLSRSRRDWAVAADRVDVAGGRIESATEPIDTATASGRFARGVMTEYAAFQSEQIGEQWAEVRARRFALGLPPTGSVPWGWVSRKTHIEPHPERAPFVAAAYRLYLEGRGMTYIAGWLNRSDARTLNGRDWIQATVRKLLDSPVHAGYVEYRGEVKRGAHTGIISESDWARYQARRRDRHVPMKARTSKHLLSSLVVCNCGRKRYGNTTIARHDGTTRYHSYVCPSTVPHPPRAKTIATWRVDAAVSNWVKGISDASPALSEANAVRDDVEAVAREIVAAERRLVKLTEHLLSGLVPESAYRASRDNLNNEIARLNAELAKMQRSRKINPADYLRGIRDLAARWDTAQFDEKQAALRTLIESVTILEARKIEIVAVWGEHVVIDL